MLKIYINKIDIVNTDSKVTILKNVYFSVKAGQIISIIGANGSGKSTLLKSILGLLDKSRFQVYGRIEFNGMDLQKLPKDDLRRIRGKKIRMVFQDPKTAFDPIRKISYYFNLIPEKTENVKEYCSLLSLDDVESIQNLYPAQLSSGMAQRIAIALAAGVDPELILLDEPTSAVDVYTANELLDFLKLWCVEKNRAALVVTQDIDFAESVSDKILFLNNKTLKVQSPLSNSTKPK